MVLRAIQPRKRLKHLGVFRMRKVSKPNVPPSASLSLSVSLCLSLSPPTLHLSLSCTHLLEFAESLVVGPNRHQLTGGVHQAASLPIAVGELDHRRGDAHHPLQPRVVIRSVTWFGSVRFGSDRFGSIWFRLRGTRGVGEEGRERGEGRGERVVQGEQATRHWS